VTLGVDEAAGGDLEIGDDQLGGVRRRGGADVGREVAQGDVDLVADRGDDGDRARSDGADEGFIVEGPEIFAGAAAAAEDDDVDAGPRL
jgi:hypothetical protein